MFQMLKAHIGILIEHNDILGETTEGGRKSNPKDAIGGFLALRSNANDIFHAFSGFCKPRFKCQSKHIKI
jgi:hypothetical protein